MTITDKTVSAIMQEPVIFRITVNKTGILHRLRILPKEKKIILKPMVCGTLLRISKEVNDIKFNSEEKLEGVNLIAKAFESALSDTQCLINVLALAITNSEKRPGEKLKKFLLENLTTAQMMKILMMVVNQLNVNDFLNSIILVKGMSLVKGEIIAPGE